jgi:predicted NAD/FAD-dependent oxidoreductase
VEGQGSPCQPDSLRPQQFRLAFEEGVSAFPKHLARGLDVECEVTVTQVTPERGGWEISTDRGPIRARTLVLALALEQAVRLLEVPARSLPEVASTVSLLGMFGSVPCLTVMAGYQAEAPSPAWDLLLPGGAGPLQLISHDSSKRRAPVNRVLVAQARGSWSRRHLEDPREDWGRFLLKETARLVGSWAGRPAWAQFHRWGHARIDLDSRLAQPILLRTPGGGRLGLTGELFLPGGGIEAAWQSGAELARRLLREDDDEP